MALVFEHSCHCTSGHCDSTGNSELPFGKKKNASNAPGQQKAVRLGQNNTIGIYFWFIRRGLQQPPAPHPLRPTHRSPQKNLSPFPRANTPKVPLNCQHHPRMSRKQDFFFFFFPAWSKVKWKFTMTFRLIHTHLTSFYSSCLRKDWYTKFAEMRGGRMKKM